MPALAERTKIRSEKGFETCTTTGWTIMPDTPFVYYGFKIGDEAIDLYSSDSSSIRVQSIPYLTRPSVQAQTTLQKILRYKYLVKGWDENDAVPPDSETIIRAYTFASTADEFDLPFYFTAPGPNGEIVVEFKEGSKTAEVYFNEDGSSEMLLYNGKEQVYADEINMEILTQHLR
jgi:hypothetical protein